MSGRVKLRYCNAPTTRRNRCELFVVLTDVPEHLVGQGVGVVCNLPSSRYEEWRLCIGFV